MSAIAIAGLGIVVLLVLIFFRVPIAVALGLVGYFGYASIEGFQRAGLILGSTPIELASAHTFSVVPLFTLMGAVAAVSGLSSDLFRAANACFRGARGTLSVASIFASGMFGAICGSSVATALTMSKVSIPEMLEAGYPRSLAAGAVAAGGTLGILIPPSLILMIYAIIAQLSIAELFAAALVPGILLMVFYSIIAFALSWRMIQSADPAASALAATAAPAEPLLRALARTWHVLALFLLSIGGIYAGWFTPTEAAAVGAMGAIVLALVLRRASLAEMGRSLLETVRLVASVIFIVMTSSIFSYFIVQAGLSDVIARWMGGIGLGPIGVIAVLCFIYILMGCFLEGIAMILITVPITLPLIISLGYDPVWFGVLLVILIEIGLVTPPMGMNLFVIKGVRRDLELSDIYRGVMPFLLAPMGLITLIVLWPEVVLWLPHALY